MYILFFFLRNVHFVLESSFSFAVDADELGSTNVHCMCTTRSTQSVVDHLHMFYVSIPSISPVSEHG
jgi:hypothetical protein